MIVHEESWENRNRNDLLYKIKFDSFGNPLKYIRYQVYNHEGGLDGLDSVTYVYTYDKKGYILVKKQHFYYREPDDGRYSDLIFKFKYNKQGQDIGYTVSNTKKKIYSVEKEYTNGLLHKRNATYNYYDDLKNYYDSTEYFYGKNLKLDLIKRTYFHNPLHSQSDEILIKFLYDKNGFLSEEYPLVFKEKNHTFYKWELYD
ncbi:hypothetical protein HX039_01495 [Myroides marinus]|uniref:hypothetical protein n=1 Tax=Myroides marinus TaxID=703342 RepID=UPI0025784BCB|nr:hypothetical protein [Myroides marinus]MDM1402781.1 hypothetical protein [Myroides marinus]